MSNPPDFITREIMGIGREVTGLSAKMDAFIKSQERTQEDVKAIRGDVSKLQEEVRGLQLSSKVQKAKAGLILGGIASVFSTAMIFIVAWAKAKLGL